MILMNSSSIEEKKRQLELILMSPSAMDHKEQEAVNLGTPSIESLPSPGVDHVCSLSWDEYEYM